jgi:hypothetical protein
MEEVKMNVELMFECSTTSILIIEKRKNSDIVIGVPHHAPVGIKYLPCKNKKSKNRVSDENAGFLGRYIAEKLDCHSVIACNYTSDVNKYFRSDYTMQIAQWNPTYLVEIHGHGGKKTKNYIEISSGPTNNKYSMDLANKLTDKCSKNKILKNAVKGIMGDYNNSSMRLKAKDAVTINDGRWLPFHIELPQQLRIPANKKVGKPPTEGYLFCDCLIEALKEICRP